MHTCKALAAVRHRDVKSSTWKHSTTVPGCGENTFLDICFTTKIHHADIEQKGEMQVRLKDACISGGESNSIEP